MLTQHVDGSTSRVTTLSYDWRNRLTDTDGELDDYERNDYDNLNRVIRTERYDTTAQGNLVARDEVRYDDRGRVYQTVHYAVDPSTGAVGNLLVDNTWYDAAGGVIKQMPAGSQLFTKTLYDGAGRVIRQYQEFGLDETLYSEALHVDGDTILEQTEMSYDAAGNLFQTTMRQRYHNATGTGELGSPGSAQPKARVSYLAQWHDPVGRVIATADYGTNGGTALNRPATVPSSSDTVLVNTTGYNSAGEAHKTVDPAGREDRHFSVN